MGGLQGACSLTTDLSVKRGGIAYRFTTDMHIITKLENLKGNAAS